VIDMIQFFIKMTAVIAAAYFAVTLPAIGGMSGLVDKLGALPGPGGLRYLDALPDFTSNGDLAIAVFVMPLAVQWWAVWYPGSEPGGGSYIAQRMLASKSEKDALGAVLFFNLAHYVLRPWPWILVGLASLVIYPELADIQRAFPHLDPRLVGHDTAYPAMLKFLPVGFLGLMVGGLVAANSSTILTHLNWGASYCVNDFYRRFVKKDASERHYVVAARVSTVLLFVCSSGLVFLLDSAKGAFDLILQIGAGTGLLYIVRWYWWRVNAWCEVVAMASSFVVSLAFAASARAGVVVSTHAALLVTIMVTSACWITAAFVAPATSDDVLVSFYRRVRPVGPGWARIRALSAARGGEDPGAATDENVPLGIAGWVSGCVLIWSALFTVGNVLYGRTAQAVGLAVVALGSGAVLTRVVRALWAPTPGPTRARP
jgi:Na+/proline symporter